MNGTVSSFWLGRAGRRFTRLMNLGVARDIQVLTYPFELNWLLGYQTREHNIMKANLLPVKERARILGIEPDLLPVSKSIELHPQGGKASPDQPMLDFERRLSRRPSSPPVIGSQWG